MGSVSRSAPGRAKKWAPRAHARCWSSVDRSASLCARGLHHRLRDRSRVSAPHAGRTRGAVPTIAEDSKAVRSQAAAEAQRLQPAPRCRLRGRVLEEPRQGAAAPSWRRAARARRPPPGAASQRSARRLAWPRSCARPAASGVQTTTRRSVSERTRSTWPASARWSSIWVTVAGRQPRRAAQLAGRQLARAPAARSAARTARG